MDGTGRIARWTSDKDDYMPILEQVSLCRGRTTRPDTHIPASFTAKELDAAATLSRKDIMSIRDGRPSQHAIEMIQRRIIEAGHIKYGNSSNG